MDHHGVSGMIFEIIDHVATYSGGRADDYPVSFEYHGREQIIIEILDRWYESGVNAGSPTYHYFKVQTELQKEWILRHNLRFDSWSVLFR